MHQNYYLELLPHLTISKEGRQMPHVEWKCVFLASKVWLNEHSLISPKDIPSHWEIEPRSPA